MFEDKYDMKTKTIFILLIAGVRVAERIAATIGATVGATNAETGCGIQLQKPIAPRRLDNVFPQ